MVRILCHFERPKIRAFEYLTSGDNKMTDAESRELDIEVLRSGGKSGNLNVYNWQPLLCILGMSDVVTLSIVVRTDVSGNQPKCLCVLSLFQLVQIRFEQLRTREFRLSQDRLVWLS